ncbi:hypothetical protein SUGI_0190930 [Cryptomeria japonica]|nr:hypothetical protein SUGI_0190930 [Cryptomeria japonica]
MCAAQVDLLTAGLGLKPATSQTRTWRTLVSKFLGTGEWDLIPSNDPKISTQKQEIVDLVQENCRSGISRRPNNTNDVDGADLLMITFPAMKSSTASPIL